MWTFEKAVVVLGEGIKDEGGVFWRRKVLLEDIDHPSMLISASTRACR